MQGAGGFLRDGESSSLEMVFEIFFLSLAFGQRPIRFRVEMWEGIGAGESAKPWKQALFPWLSFSTEQSLPERKKARKSLLLFSTGLNSIHSLSLCVFDSLQCFVLDVRAITMIEECRQRGRPDRPVPRNGAQQRWNVNLGHYRNMFDVISWWPTSSTSHPSASFSSRRLCQCKQVSRAAAARFHPRGRPYTSGLL
jgi:hypothetical protein